MKEDAMNHNNGKNDSSPIENDDLWRELEAGGWSRGRFLKAAGLLSVGGLFGRAAMASAASDAVTGVAPASNQVLTLNLTAAPPTLDPALDLSSQSSGVLRLAFDTLLRPKPDLSDVAPLAAEGYEVSSDGLKYTFHLRTKATWTDGKPVTGSDFVYAWRRLLDPTTAASIANPDFTSVVHGAAKYPNIKTSDKKALAAYLAGLGISAPNDHTFVVRLQKKAPYFKWLAVLIMGAPVRQDVLEKYGADKWYLQPESLVSNGQFKVSEIVPNDHVTLVRNDAYTGKKAKLTQINLLEISDPNADFARYMNGEVDIVNVASSNTHLVTSNPTLKKELRRVGELRTEWVMFNTKKAPFNNLNVRRAFALSIDRNTLANEVLRGLAIPATTLVPKGLVGYTPNAGAALEYNVDKARAALKASGMSASDLSGITAIVRNMGYIDQAAEYLQGQWQDNLGIKVNLETLEFAAAYPKLQAEQFQMCITYGWQCDYPDPQDYFSVLFGSGSGFNHSGYANPAFDALVAKADQGSSVATRTKLYAQAQKMLSRDVPAAFLYQLNPWVLVKPYVQGLVTTQIDDWWGDYNAGDVWIAQH
jgi:oligopeptide transport system substrate-binding protein